MQKVFGRSLELQQRAVAILEDVATRPFAVRLHFRVAAIGEVELNRAGIEHDELRLAAWHMIGEMAREWLADPIGGAAGVETHSARITREAATNSIAPMVETVIDPIA